MQYPYDYLYAAVENVGVIFVLLFTSRTKRLGYRSLAMDDLHTYYVLVLLY